MWFAIKTPFKLLFVLLYCRANKDLYSRFKQFSRDKHFYKWQWRMLDRIYKHSNIKEDLSVKEVE